MNLVREIASLGRNARSAANLKVRQPLAKVEVILADTTHQKWLEEHAALIAEELNVKPLNFRQISNNTFHYSVVPNFKRLGPRLGKNMQIAKKLLGEINAITLLAELKSIGKTTLTFPDGSAIDLDTEDIEVRLQAKEGWAAAQGQRVVVVLSTELTPDLEEKGIARTVAHVGNELRKRRDFGHSDRLLCVHFVCDESDYRAAVERHREYICDELLAQDLQVGTFEEYKKQLEMREAHAEKDLIVRVNIKGYDVPVSLLFDVQKLRS